MEECNICLSIYYSINENKKPIVLTNCGHTLHNKCFKELKENDADAKCPKCRAEISSTNAINYAILPFFETKNYKFVKMENVTKNSINMVQKLSERKIKAKHPVIAAITHESFFVHYKNKNLKIYDFGLWDFHSLNYKQYHIFNMHFIILIWFTYNNYCIRVITLRNLYVK